MRFGYSDALSLAGNAGDLLSCTLQVTSLLTLNWRQILI